MPTQISLDVRGKKNLEESLDFYCQGELMEGDNQYFCEEIAKKVKAACLETARLYLHRWHIECVAICPCAESTPGSDVCAL